MIDAERRRNRRSPMPPGQRARTQKQAPQKQCGECYSITSCSRAIKDDLQISKRSVRTPNRLGHNAATRLRTEPGIETVGRFSDTRRDPRPRSTRSWTLNRLAVRQLLQVSQQRTTRGMPVSDAAASAVASTSAARSGSGLNGNRMRTARSFSLEEDGSLTRSSFREFHH